MNKLPRVTAEEIFHWNPCKPYTLELISFLMGDKDTVNAIDVLKNETLPANDKLWLISYTKLFVPDEILEQAKIDLLLHFHHKEVYFLHEYDDWHAQHLLKLLEKDYE